MATGVDKTPTRHYYHNPEVTDLAKLQHEAREYARKGVVSKIHRHSFSEPCPVSTTYAGEWCELIR